MATTAVELQPIPQNAALAPTASARRNDPVAASSSTEDILEASRLADSEVPDGGYGWVVITGCAVLTWHVSDCLPARLYAYITDRSLANQDGVCSLLGPATAGALSKMRS